MGGRSARVLLPAAVAAKNPVLWKKAAPLAGKCAVIRQEQGEKAKRRKTGANGKKLKRVKRRLTLAKLRT